jgi:hypothetical protein
VEIDSLHFRAYEQEAVVRNRSQGGRVNFTCTSPERGVFSDQTGRSYNGKSINKKQALIVDEPYNARTPRLCGVLLTCGERINWSSGKHQSIPNPFNRQANK